MNAWSTLIFVVMMWLVAIAQAHPVATDDDLSAVVEGTLDTMQHPDSRDGTIDSEISMYTQHFSGIVDAGYLWKDNMEVREGQIDRVQPHDGILDTGLNAPWPGFTDDDQ